MNNPLSHGLLASAGVAHASSATMGSGSAAFAHDLPAHVLEAENLPELLPLVGSQLQSRKDPTV